LYYTVGFRFAYRSEYRPVCALKRRTRTLLATKSTSDFVAATIHFVASRRGKIHTGDKIDKIMGELRSYVTDNRSCSLPL